MLEGYEVPCLTSSQKNILTYYDIDINIDKYSDNKNVAMWELGIIPS